MFKSVETTIYNHITNKSGCTNCNKKLKWTLDRFITKAVEIHGYKYDYSNILPQILKVKTRKYR